MKEIVLIGEGRNRLVYQHGNYVIKLPKNDEGVGDNYHEYDTYKRSLRETLYCKYARCV